ncbi:MAG: hypothetical protein IT290_09135 [Deltaproteobacteria bacterium]|nr:hypothetical protein [Deltaproteobacteria bacterium]
MRTTVVLDSDVAKALRQLRQKSEKSFREVLNETLRVGLSINSGPAPKSKKFTVRSIKGGFRPGIDPEALNKLLDQLDVEDFLSKHSRRS